MICAEAKELLESYVQGSADAAARAALEAHFATCEGCRLEAELTRGVHAQPGDAERAPLELEPMTTSPVSPADADEEISFRDLVLELPQDTSTAAPTVPPPSPAAPSQAAAPPAAAPAAGPREGAAAPPERKSSAPAWDFEPVDLPRESGPPAESLNLAEQALTRKAEAKAKGKVAAFRVALWAAGGLSGIALLGVSIWIALAFNQSPSGESNPGMIRPREAPKGASAEAGVPLVAGYQDSVAALGSEGTSLDESGGPQPAPAAAPDGSIQGRAGDTETGTPSEAGPLRAQSLPAAGGGPSVGLVAPSKAMKPAPTGSTSKGPSTGAKAAGTASAPARAVPSRPATGPETASGPTVAGGSRKALGPKPPPDDLEPVTDESEIPFTTVTRRELKPTPSSTGSTQAGGALKPAPDTAPPTVATTVEDPAGGAAGSTPPPPPRPIDRLAEATGQAATAGDLETLRKLKASWKEMIRTATRGERARAKREYADCLWAIQELSGRIADRREALAAYREYVLYAPAGANDARTVGRMRFLEDVIAESE